MESLSWDVAAGNWPEAIAQAAKAGRWPGDEETEGVVEAALNERMKLLALRGMRPSTRRASFNIGLTAGRSAGEG